MPEKNDSTQRLANRLADLRQLGDQNRAAHPVSVLRNDIVADALKQPNPSRPRRKRTVGNRAEALARRMISPVLARAEQIADKIRDRRRNERFARPSMDVSRQAPEPLPDQDNDGERPAKS